MVLTVAEAMANFNTRNTMVFCLWSGEEGGKRGSDFWTDYWVKEDNPNVEVTNYVNLDMAGVNWPGGGGAPCGGSHGGGEGGCDPQPAVDPDGYPKDEEVWPMRVYIGPSLDHDIMNQPGMVGLAMWIGSDAIGVEEQMSMLIGTIRMIRGKWTIGWSKTVPRSSFTKIRQRGQTTLRSKTTSAPLPWALVDSWMGIGATTKRVIRWMK